MTLIHGYSYLVSLEIIVGFKKLRIFQRTKVNLSVLLEKPDITYGGTRSMESLEPSCGISPKTSDHPENTLFRWGPPIFPNITGD